LPLLYSRRGEGMALLISRHRDGGHLTELSEWWGYRVVRGSSKRGGEAGLLGLVRHLRDGAEVALTPDGPRGPAERVKPGALAAAHHADALVIAAGARASSAWWLRSWDRFCVPKPFAAVEVVYSAPCTVGAGTAGPCRKPRGPRCRPSPGGTSRWAGPARRRSRLGSPAATLGAAASPAFCCVATAGTSRWCIAGSPLTPWSWRIRIASRGPSGPG